jgi:hypothetical protein
MRRRPALVTAMALLLTTLTWPGPASAAAQTGTDWPAYLDGPAASGYTSESLLSASNASALAATSGWPLQLNNGAVCPSSKDTCSALVAAQPTVATVAGQRMVFVGSWNGSEYAICASTCTLGSQTYSAGQVVWSTYLGRTSGCGGPDHSEVVGITGASAVTAVVIAGSSTPVVYVGAGGDVAQDGTIISGATSTMFALNALTGAVIWQASLGSAPNHYLWSSPVIANNSLYVGISSRGDCPLIQGGVVRLALDTGALLDQFNTVPNGCIGASVWGSAAVDPSGNVYVATGNGGTCHGAEPYGEAVIKLSSSLGVKSSWQIPAKQAVSDGDFGDTPTLFTGTVTPSGARRSLAGVANKNGYYYVFDTSKLASGPVIKFRIAVGGSEPEKGDGSVSPSSWDGHHLYIAGGSTTIGGTSFPGSIRAFNPNNLTSAVWQDGLKGGPVLGAVSSDPTIVIASSGAFMNVINSATGAVLYTGVASGFYGAPSIAYGVVYEGDTSGLLHAFSVNGQ